MQEFEFRRLRLQLQKAKKPTVRLTIKEKPQACFARHNDVHNDAITAQLARQAKNAETRKTRAVKRAVEKATLPPNEGIISVVDS